MSDQERIKPCHICGAAEYVWGVLGSNGGVWYQKQDVLFPASYPITARLCTECGNIELFFQDMKRIPLLLNKKKKRGEDQV
jgi:hypothetical protein